jgi:hypothetical protein
MQSSGSKSINDPRKAELISIHWLPISPEKEITRVESEVLRLEKTLHYKDERAMTSQTFFAKTKPMFNIFEEVGEPKPESAKIRFLLTACEIPSFSLLSKPSELG